MKAEGGTSAKKELPRGWSLVPFVHVFSNITSSRLKLPRSQYLESGAYPVIDQGDQVVGGYSNDDSLVHPGPLPAIVFGDHTRCVKLVRERFIQGADGVKVLAPRGELLCSYLCWLLKAHPVPSRGYARHFAFLRKLTLPISPLPEQHRIVEAIETQFTKLDSAIAALERVRVTLKRYRASVLKAAVEGRLVPTEAELARKEGRDYEPASVLLERILKERRRRWEEAELVKMTAKGKVPKDDRWKGKYKEPVAPDTEGLPGLPGGWCWATVEQLAEVQLGRQRSPKNHSGPYMMPYLRAANITWNGIDLSDVKTMNFAPDEQPRFKLHTGDILLNEASGSRSEVGKPAFWDGRIENCCFQNTVLRVRAVPELRDWLLSHFRCDAEGGRFAHESRGVGIHHLGAAGLAIHTLALPPLREEARISSAIDQQVSVAAVTASLLEVAERKCRRLRQSILKWAFEGKLVDQDPNDEPASVLLQRIKAEREATKPAKKRGLRRGRRPSDNPGNVNREDAPPPKPAQRQLPMSSNPPEHSGGSGTLLDTDEAMGIFRRACSRTMTRDELLKEVSLQLGHKRLGSIIRQELTRLHRIAVRRRIIGTDCELAYRETKSIADYSRDDLLGFLPSVMRKGVTYDQEDVVRELAQHSGFVRVTEAVQDAVKSAISAAIRRGLLSRPGRGQLIRD